jgi:hypothetical protein
MKTKYLIHHGTDELQVNSLTSGTRCDNLVVSNGSTVQVWSWVGGDAIVVITGSLPNVYMHVVIRVGTKVQVIECKGLKSAMSYFGLNLNDYTITTTEELERAA